MDFFIIYVLSALMAGSGLEVISDDTEVYLSHSTALSGDNCILAVERDKEFLLIESGRSHHSGDHTVSEPYGHIVLGNIAELGEWLSFAVRAAVLTETNGDDADEFFVVIDNGLAFLFAIRTADPAGIEAEHLSGEDDLLTEEAGFLFELADIVITDDSEIINGISEAAVSDEGIEAFRLVVDSLDMETALIVNFFDSLLEFFAQVIRNRFVFKLSYTMSFFYRIFDVHKQLPFGKWGQRGPHRWKAQYPIIK